MWRRYVCAGIALLALALGGAVRADTIDDSIITRFDGNTVTIAGRTFKVGPATTYQEDSPPGPLKPSTSDRLKESMKNSSNRVSGSLQYGTGPHVGWIIFHYVPPTPSKPTGAAQGAPATGKKPNAATHAKPASKPVPKK
jgi:hypothetical protein